MTIQGSICIYGKSGVGKTLDAHHAFAAMFKRDGLLPLTIVTERGATDSVVSNLGFSPAEIHAFDVDAPHLEAQRAIAQAHKLVVAGQHRAVILDTGTSLCDRIFAQVSREVRDDGRRLYPKVTTLFSDVLLRFLSIPAWVCVIFHEAPHKVTEGMVQKGGPRVPHAGLTEKVCSLFSLVLRASRVMLPGDMEASRCYECDQLSPTYLMKDRYGAASKVQPLDLRPILWRIAMGDQPVPAFPAKPIRTQDQP